MASLSDHLLVVAILAYLAAMMCHTAGLSLRPAPRRATSAPSPVLAASIAGGAPVAAAAGHPSLTSPGITERPTDTHIAAAADRDPARTVAPTISPPRGHRWIAIAATVTTGTAVLSHFGAVLVNLFGVNLFFGGLHSYAGVK